MEPVLFMKTACALLAVAAVGGLALAGISFKAQPPAWLAMLHGLLAGAALTLLLYAYFTVGLPGLAGVALLLFLIAAAGGAYLNLNFHWKNLVYLAYSSNPTTPPAATCSWPNSLTGMSRARQSPKRRSDG